MEIFQFLINGEAEIVIILGMVEMFLYQSVFTSKLLSNTHPIFLIRKRRSFLYPEGSPKRIEIKFLFEIPDL